MPSWARLVATATIGRPAERRGELGDVERAAAADPHERVVEARRAGAWRARWPRRRRRRRASRSRRSRARGRSVSAISSPSPGPTTTATWPPAEIRRSASSGASWATAPGPMSTRQRRPDHPGQQRQATSRARARSRVVVDLGPLDRADRRDADVAAAVGVLLEAVLVVELRVALERRLQRVGERRPPPPARSASGRCTRPARSPGSSALLMRVMRPVRRDVHLHLLLAERLDVVEREQDVGPAAPRAASPRRSAGGPCRR